MDLAIGIDVGFSATRRSTGVILMDRATKTAAVGSIPFVATAADAERDLRAELARLKPASATICADGSFAAVSGTKVRSVERFFMSGPFASTPASGVRLRLSPAPTPVGSKFLASTRRFVDVLRSLGFSTMSVTGSGLNGDVVEIFPTLFMAALLPPQAYTGSRSSHSDDLWLRLIGRGPTPGTVHPALSPYATLFSLVEGSALRDRHDLRAAAISAIAADWYASQPSVMFVGHATELGFVLPPRAVCDPAFLAMLSTHWQLRASSLSALMWLG